MELSMSTSFEKYSDILLDAFQSNPRSDDLIIKKQEIIEDLLHHFNIEATSVLFIGFTPNTIRAKFEKLFVTAVSNSAAEHITRLNPAAEIISFDNIRSHNFDVVIAVDEFLTFADTDTEQKDLIATIGAITKKLFITTLKDYKNQDFKDREFSQPITVRKANDKKIYFEHYEYDQNDRNSFTGTNYIIDGDGVAVIGPFARRSMYFKQLAKFSFDNGAQAFLVHQNLMHKSMIKKNYEHIITVRF